MSEKDNLLSIGEMSKITGAGIKSLRYYESINILKPAFIDPYSGYRYYTFNQTYLVNIIMFCIELDIPLKELTKFNDADDILDFRKLLHHGKNNVEKKLKSLNKGLNLINELEQKMNLFESYKIGQIYSREIPEKIFYSKPCGKSLKNVNNFEIFKSMYDIPNYEDNELLEYGFLCDYSSTDVQYYVFIEIPKHIINENIMVIPAGNYFCIQNEYSQIEQVTKILKKYIKNQEPFLAVETDVFTGKQRIDKPINELRVIIL
jgi:DNA-binding transcriptional MerR regulator